MKRKNLVAIAIAAASLGMATPAFAAQGSGGGGGGTGGGGGGGGTGGGGSTAGAIRTVSAAPACDAGSVMTVDLSKGFQNRVELGITGIAVVDGRWEIRVQNVTTSSQITGMATNLGGSFRLTTLGGTVPVGVSEVRFTATRRDFGSTFEATMGPLLETCTATMVVTGR